MKVAVYTELYSRYFVMLPLGGRCGGWAIKHSFSGRSASGYWSVAVQPQTWADRGFLISPHSSRLECRSGTRVWLRLAGWPRSSAAASPRPSGSSLSHYMVTLPLLPGPLPGQANITALVCLMGATAAFSVNSPLASTTNRHTGTS